MQKQMVLGVLAGWMIVVGCGGGSSGDDGSTPTPTPSPTATAPPSVTEFDGIWSNGSGTLKYQGVGSRINFHEIAFTTSNTGWYDAQQKAFIAIGDAWIRNIVPDGNNNWTAEVLWNTGNTTDGVTSVDWSTNSSLSLANGGTELLINTQSPYDGNYGNATVYLE